ncbi:MAG TPA: APC family permease [Actinoplanes sp.]|nr:APC family permease [Actinoplanes sp.]
MPQPATSPLAAGRLGASALFFFAVAAAAPTVVVGFVVPAAYAGDIRFVPLVFLAAGLILLLYSVGYGAMAGTAPNAGALYTFIARGLGRPIGVGAAWLALLSYHAIQIGLYGVAGMAAAPLLEGWFGVTADWWMVAGGCWFAVALCGLLRADLAGGLLAVIVLAEIAVILGFAAADVFEPAPGGITWNTLVPGDPAALDRPALGLLLVVATFAFVGFETTAAYAEEAARPRRSIPRATAVALLAMAVLYAAFAWATSVATGPDVVAARSAGRGTELIFDLAADRLAPWAVTLGRLLLLTGLLAAMISLHHTIARYLFALSRERVLFRLLRRTAGRVPLVASVTQSLVAIAALAGVYAAGWDPLTQTFRLLTTVGALGVLVLLFASSMAALLFLNRVPGDASTWQRFAAPAPASVLLGVLVYLAFANLPALLDVPSGHVLTYGVPGAFAVAVLFGISYAYVMKAVSPITYAGLGLGGSAVVVTPAVPKPREPGAHRPERIIR